jgi:hypothetical protein
LHVAPAQILQPSPQSNSGTTTITTGTNYTIGGSIGWTQDKGFNASISGGVTITNSSSTTVPPIMILATPELQSGTTNWLYTATNGGMQSVTLYDSWIWVVPFKAYSPDQTTLNYFASGDPALTGFPDVGAYDKASVPLPFGDTFNLGSPTVTNVSVPSVKPGETFMIDGTALYPSLIQGVLIGGQPLAPANYEAVSDTEIQVSAPATPGNSLPVVVKTSLGLSNSNVTINIEGAPVPQTQPIAAVAGQAIANVPVASFTDSDPDATTTDFAATITWGDGTESAGTITSAGQGSFEVLGTHTYATAGKYIFGVHVAEGGSSASNTATATVSAAGGLQRLVAQPVEAVAGGAFTNVTVASFTDSDSDVNPADFDASIDWGDGYSNVTSVISAGPGIFDVLGTHTYLAAGAYTFHVRVSIGGDSAATASGTASVES